ncbi:hypothetical protein L596_003204 [Steinernema carpocapsae]|uniref:Serpin domain-containing protein n=1 Tax=Steinernema carpocapsae TaxID=34508 RepID=A0A4U8UTE9_STECR|nr:hypothetical protein L596_003204 [Steinernema carpocapsae]
MDSHGKANSIAAAQADFALQLLRRNKHSTVVSPFSIATALAMVYGGAQGNTKHEMKSVLAKENTDEELHQFLKNCTSSALSTKTANASGETYLEMANKVFVEAQFDILAEFSKFLESRYEGNLEHVDFSDSAAAVKDLNAWVEQTTHGHIKDLIDSSIINSLTKMILVNAAYFKGTWRVKFDQNRTNEETFYVSEGVAKRVSMMAHKTKYGFAKDSKGRVLQLPYSNEGLSMFVVLPHDRYGLRDLLSNLNGNHLLDLVSSCRTVEVDVKLPKFKLESTFNLSQTLKEMGIRDAFEDTADFSGISDNRHLLISDVVHKAFVEVTRKVTRVQFSGSIGGRKWNRSCSGYRCSYADASCSSDAPSRS